MLLILVVAIGFAIVIDTAVVEQLPVHSHARFTVASAGPLRSRGPRWQQPSIRGTFVPEILPRAVGPTHPSAPSQPLLKADWADSGAPACDFEDSVVKYSIVKYSIV